jgi:hypothetical protein
MESRSLERERERVSYLTGMEGVTVSAPSHTGSADCPMADSIPLAIACARQPHSR